MPSIEEKIQGVVHNLEQGGLAKWVRLSALAVGFIALALIYVLLEFRGLSHQVAMEQAQIAKEIAKGNGFSTHVVRPLAFWQMTSNEKEVPTVNFPDTYHSPLNPYVNALPVLLSKRWWEIKQGELVPMVDRVIVLVQIGFFVLSLFIWYRIAIRLFDRKIAMLGTGLLVICNLFWEFSLAGLPQMTMLFLFSASMYCLVRAIQGAAEQKRVGFWLGGCGFLFGLLALTHALAIWLFAGLILFIVLYFRPRMLSAILVLGFFVIVITPWVLRTTLVSGSPFGVAIYGVLDDVKQSEAGWMRSMEPDFSGLTLRSFRRKFEQNMQKQFGMLYGALGAGLCAPAFFFSLLHPFRRRETAAFRWVILPMWVLGVLGMCAFVIGDSYINSNQLSVLFVPAMTYYGLAFLLVLWARLPIDYRFFRICFLAGIYLISSIPMLLTLLPERSSRLQWPPYVPPGIALLGNWTGPQEVLSSDMPWAVGWYADRKCLWIPQKVSDFVQLSDYARLGGPIVGLYLTPITGDAKFIRDIMKGEYQEWAPFIMRNPNLRDIPLKAAVPLPIANECIFYADRDRWSGQTAE
jgi:hypothetical protein